MSGDSAVGVGRLHARASNCSPCGHPVLARRLDLSRVFSDGTCVAYPPSGNRLVGLITSVLCLERGIGWTMQRLPWTLYVVLATLAHGVMLVLSDAE